MKIAFIQPFSLSDANGGARILRGLVAAAPAPVISINSGWSPNESRSAVPNEIFLPFRPHFGRLERTRFAWLPSLLDPFWLRVWTPRLRRCLTDHKVTHVHVVPHTGLDFEAASRCASSLALPLAVSVHDHPQYCFRGAQGSDVKMRLVGQIWRAAQSRFVISAVMGESMNQSFGERSFEVITDGVGHQALPQKERSPGILHIYFMGLFHQGYIPNLVCLIEALGNLALRNPAIRIMMTLRCGNLPTITIPTGVELKVLPFASEDEVRRDIESADLLYLPLPFGEAYHDFVTYSLSTKMVTYLGSGRPILYHGPESAAACCVLSQHQAAFIVDCMEPSRMASIIEQATPDCVSKVVKQALQLTDSQFRERDIQERFWGGFHRN